MKKLTIYITWDYIKEVTEKFNLKIIEEIETNDPIGNEYILQGTLKNLTALCNWSGCEDYSENIK